MSKENGLKEKAVTSIVIWFATAMNNRLDKINSDLPQEMLSAGLDMVEETAESICASEANESFGVEVEEVWAEEEGYKVKIYIPELQARAQLGFRRRMEEKV